MRKIDLKSASLLLVLGLPMQMALAATELPKPFTFTRYQPMMDRSPFAVATAMAPPPTAPNFAKDLYVANAARAKEGDLVTVASSTDKNWKKYLTTAAPVEGISITNIEWSEKIGATKVTIAKDGQTATIGFNEALLHPGPGGQNPMAQNPAAAQNMAPPPPGQIPPQREAQDKGAVAGQAPVAPGVQPPNSAKAMPVPMLPTPPPRVRGIIPRNPAAGGQPLLQQKPQQPAPQQQPQQLQQKPSS